MQYKGTTGNTLKLIEFRLISKRIIANTLLFSVPVMSQSTSKDQIYIILTKYTKKSLKITLKLPSTIPVISFVYTSNVLKHPNKSFETAANNAFYRENYFGTTGFVL